MTVTRLVSGRAVRIWSHFSRESAGTGREALSDKAGVQNMAISQAIITHVKGIAVS